ncbi:PREDICTED: uncharacterized protein LOC105959113 [Olea europaea subsp. europaea]|uniref:PREDICTED: uncharacterized protein LOC105959113 n=1 Tax=Olea europaea subsp. europaea TaxID=158383 RepID=A0A8S0R5J3_OLEEU|nr:PREDICTED: uncharacterized protein LOC105959113 [Olea europaea subsp. europaea]
MKMEIGLHTPTLQVASFINTRRFKLRDYNAFQRSVDSLLSKHVKVKAGETFRISSALPETVASVAVAATVVGAAATILRRRTKSSEVTETPTKTCEDCGGSGICSECNGEGFVLKRLSEDNAEKARLMAKNMATRYTAGLPKKWSYCTKCSSARSCSFCGGSGKISF